MARETKPKAKPAPQPEPKLEPVAIEESAGEPVPKYRVLPNGNVDRNNAAIYLGRKPRTLAQWAWQGRGPPVIIINGRAFYNFRKLQEFSKGKPQELASAG